jgi:hypothetical protein
MPTSNAGPISEAPSAQLKKSSFKHLTARKDSMMQKYKLGNLEVSAIGLGCMAGLFVPPILP